MKKLKLSWIDGDIHNTASYASQSESMKPLVFAAFEIEYGNADHRYEPIPQFESHEAYQWMEDFVDTRSQTSRFKRDSVPL